MSAWRAMRAFVFLPALFVCLSGLSGSLWGTPIGCSQDAGCSGYTFNAYLDSQAPGSYDIYLQMGIDGNTVGGDPPYLQAIALKVGGVSKSASARTSLTDFWSSNPGAPSGGWDETPGGLSVTGCAGYGGGGFSCWEWDNGTTVFPFHIGDTLVWLFNVSSPTAPTSLQVSYLYTYTLDTGHRRDRRDEHGGEHGDQSGYLCQVDLKLIPDGDPCQIYPGSCEAPPPPSETPEPAAMGLMGVGLAGLSILARWRSRR